MNAAAAFGARLPATKVRSQVSRTFSASLHLSRNGDEAEVRRTTASRRARRCARHSGPGWARGAMVAVSSRTGSCARAVRSRAKEREHGEHPPVAVRNGRQVELGEDAAHVRLDGLLAQAELLGQRAVGVPLR